MSREEEIKKKAKELAIYFAGENDYKESAAYSAAMGMAEFADQHPKKGLWDAQKVIKWLKEYTDDYIVRDTDDSWLREDDFIRDLRKAMEG